MGLSGGLLGGLLNLVFGSDRNVVVQTAEMFRENAENGAERDAIRAKAALDQFAAEFARPDRSLFDRVIDGMNRVPRPALALGTLGLFVSAMADPIWFAERMQGIALVPEPLWWLMGAVVSFYFGARHQAKSQEFQRSITSTLARAPDVAEGIRALRALEAGAAARAGGDVERGMAPGHALPEEVHHAVDAHEATADIASDNAALTEWRAARE